MDEGRDASISSSHKHKIDEKLSLALVYQMLNILTRIVYDAILL